jgi:Xaa-Pro aminopeptidase
VSAHKRRRAALRKRLSLLGLDALLVTDLTNIAYLTGFVGTAGIAVVGRQTALIVDSRYHLQAQEQAPDVRVVLAPNTLFETAASLLLRRKAVRIGFEAQAVTVEQHRDLRKRLPGRRLVPTKDLIAELRAVKDADEIAAIRRAVAVADRVALDVLAALRPGQRERDVAALVNYWLQLRGARKHSFDTIVASGPRSALVHAQPGERRIRKRDLVLLDFGAVVDGYCSDLTRTVTLGRPTPKQREVFDIVLAAQKAAKEAIRPGVYEWQVDAAARRIIAQAGYAEYFGHGLGHGVGRAIHEFPALNRPGKRRLRAGMVVTVEPGIYLPGWGGVRIEDMVLVTADGCETLSRAPRELQIRDR